MIKIKPITTAIVLLTTGCNLRCEYCFEESLRPKNMTFDIAKDTLNFLIKNGENLRKNSHFTFFGGEPMLTFDSVMVPLIEYNKTLPKPATFSMTTNGTLLTKEKLNFLQENNIRFMLSFDGMESVQKKKRPMACGENSFNAVMKNWEDIKRSGLLSSVRGTITRDTIKYMFDNILFYENMGVENLHILPNLWEQWSREDVEIFSYQLEKYENYIIESFRNGRTPLVFWDYGKSFWRISAALLLEDSRRVLYSNSPQGRCGMGVRGSCSIAPDGDIFGCHHISPLNRDSSWYLGNIYDGIDEQRILNLIGKYDKNKIGNEKCKDCPLDSICVGGCTSTNEMVTGDPNIVPETYCLWERGITDSAYKVAKVLGEEENILFRSLFQRWCKDERGI